MAPVRLTVSPSLRRTPRVHGQGGLGGPAGGARAEHDHLNTAGQGAVFGEIIYRVYVPDRGLAVEVGSAARGVDEASPTARRWTSRRRPPDTGWADDRRPAGQPRRAWDDAADPSAEDPIRWEAFFNYAQAFSYPLQATPAGDARDIVPRDPQGGFLSNVDNAYTFALASRGIGPVLVLAGGRRERRDGRGRPRDGHRPGPLLVAV